jgi:hypothetical protein
MLALYVLDALYVSDMLWCLGDFPASGPERHSETMAWLGLVTDQWTSDHRLQIRGSLLTGLSAGSSDSAPPNTSSVEGG